MNKRINQINSLLETELSQILNRELELPKECLITLTDVETTPDLRQAQVWISILPETQTQPILGQLIKKKKQIQKILHKKLVMKPLPKLEFKVDKTEVSATRMEKILDNLK